jgi:hypothetical protein
MKISQKPKTFKRAPLKEPIQTEIKKIKDPTCGWIISIYVHNLSSIWMYRDIPRMK